MRSAKKYNETAVTSFMTDVMTSAARSFSNVSGMDITVRSVKVELTSDAQRDVNTLKKDAKLHVLITPLLGQMAGRSYLVMNDMEVEVLLKRSPFQPGNGFDQTMKEAMLKEIDNIVSASVVSDLANRFRIDLYGDVPELQVLSAEDLKERVAHYVPNGQMSFLCKGTFLAKEENAFAPDFIWKFSSAMVNQIENIGQTTS